VFQKSFLKIEINQTVTCIFNSGEVFSIGLKATGFSESDGSKTITSHFLFSGSILKTLSTKSQ
jgi:hypothetical protein